MAASSAGGSVYKALLEAREFKSLELAVKDGIVANREVRRLGVIETGPEAALAGRSGEVLGKTTEQPDQVSHCCRGALFRRSS